MGLGVLACWGSKTLAWGFGMALHQLRVLVCNYFFSAQLSKVKTACLVVNQIMVDSFSVFFNCTPAGQILDSMTVLKVVRFINRWEGWAWCFDFSKAQGSFNVGFLWLGCSVICTVETLYLFYLLFIGVGSFSIFGGGPRQRDQLQYLGGIAKCTYTHALVCM